MSCTILYSCTLCTVRYCPVLYCTLYTLCTVLYCTICTALYCIVLYCTGGGDRGKERVGRGRRMERGKRGMEREKPFSNGFFSMGFSRANGLFQRALVDLTEFFH